MKIKHTCIFGFAVLLFVNMLLFPVVVLGGEKTEAVTDKMEKSVDTKQQNKISEKRKHIIKEATMALNQTKKALKALDDKKPNEALAALETATGKLVLILARDPDLALAPVDMSIKTYDIYATPEAIKKAIAQSEDLLEEGEVQKVRSLISGLASEVVISITNIPLATYPDAIKAITPLIDEGKIEEAKRELQDTLNTLVVTDTVIPLPVMRAEAYIEEAEKLTEKKERTEEENEKLTDLLDRARKQLEMAELLGYGTKDCFKPIYEQLDEIVTKTEGGKSGTGFFDKIKKQLADFGVLS
jgi:hypothetical protein